MASSTNTSALVEWLGENGLWHGALAVRRSPVGGVGVFSTLPLPEGTVLLRIPKEHILSVQTCGIANVLAEAGVDGIHGLLLAFLYEQAWGDRSPWAPFVASILPEGQPVCLWDDRQALAGTLVDTMGGTDPAQLHQAYRQAVGFAAKHAGTLPVPSCLVESKQGFETYAVWMQAVASRMFEVDAFHGVALVPGACLFNHRTAETVHGGGDEHVHFVCDGDVCEQCGDEDCEHREGEPALGPELEPALGSELELELELENPEADNSDSSVIDPATACDIVLVRPVPAATELFNTYGALPNAELLQQYGFLLPSNPADYVSLARQAKAYLRAHRTLQHRVDFWKTSAYEAAAAALGIDEPCDWQHEPRVEVNGEPLPLTCMLARLMTMLGPEFVRLKLARPQRLAHRCARMLRPDEAALRVVLAWVQQKQEEYQETVPDTTHAAAIRQLVETEKRIIAQALGQ